MLSVHLVETSPALRAAQKRALAASGVPLAWHDSLGDVPPGPAIVIGNEFLDALPLRQFVRTATGWHERLVGLDPAGSLVFGLSGEPERGIPETGEPGDVLELARAALDVTRQIAERLVASGGAALLIDYGHVRSGFGDTLQAMRHHAYADPLAEPGEADLTVHVDFAAIDRAAASAGAMVHGPVTQGAFLDALGIRARAAALSRKAVDPAVIAAALARLAGTDEGQMGELFKVIGLSSPSLPALPALPILSEPR
jgi:SAM-dependent MidA family methyltransferase